jgi:hypothetical protein
MPASTIFAHLNRTNPLSLANILIHITAFAFMLFLASYAISADQHVLKPDAAAEQPLTEAQLQEAPINAPDLVKAREAELTVLLDNYTKAQQAATDAAAKHLDADTQRLRKAFAEQESNRIKDYIGKFFGSEKASITWGYIMSHGPALVGSGVVLLGAVAVLSGTFFPASWIAAATAKATVGGAAGAKAVAAGAAAAAEAIPATLIPMSFLQTIYTGHQKATRFFSVAGAFSSILSMKPIRDYLFPPALRETINNPRIVLPSDTVLPQKQFMSLAEAEAYAIEAKRRLLLAEFNEAKTYGVIVRGPTQVELAIAKKHFLQAQKEAIDSIKTIISKNITDLAVQNYALSVRRLNIYIGYVDVTVKATIKQFEEVFKKSWSPVESRDFLANPINALNEAKEQKKMVLDRMNAVDIKGLSETDLERYKKVNEWMDVAFARLNKAVQQVDDYKKMILPTGYLNVGSAAP